MCSHYLHGEVIITSNILVKLDEINIRDQLSSQINELF